MWLIILLILIAVLLLIAELVLLPGVSVAGIGAFLTAGAAIWIAFVKYGNNGGLITIGVVAVLSVVAAIIALRSKTWQRFSLKEHIDGTSQQLPQDHNVALGDRGIAVTRLAPMGKVSINGNSFEAKGIDAYIDQNTEIEVIGFDNFNVVVKRITN